MAGCSSRLKCCYSHTPRPFPIISVGRLDCKSRSSIFRFYEASAVRNASAYRPICSNGNVRNPIWSISVGAGISLESRHGLTPAWAIGRRATDRTDNLPAEWTAPAGCLEATERGGFPARTGLCSDRYHGVLLTHRVALRTYLPSPAQSGYTFLLPPAGCPAGRNRSQVRNYYLSSTFAIFR